MDRRHGPQPQKPEFSAREKRAYELRELGLSWAEVAGALGFANRSAAYNAAARHEATLTVEQKYGRRKFT